MVSLLLLDFTKFCITDCMAGFSSCWCFLHIWENLLGFWWFNNLWSWLAVGLEKFSIVLPSCACWCKSFMFFLTSLEEILVDLNRAWALTWTSICLWWTMLIHIIDDVILVLHLIASYIHRITTVAMLCPVLEWCCNVWHLLAYSIRYSLASIG